MSLLLNYGLNPDSLRQQPTTPPAGEGPIGHAIGPSLPAPGSPFVLTALPTPAPAQDNPVSVMGYVYPNLVAIAAAINTVGQTEPGVLASGTVSWNLAIPITQNPSGPGGNLSFKFSQAQAAASGARGWTFDRPAGENSAHTLDWALGGTHAWGMGMDADSSVTPFPDLILAYAYGTGDPGDNIRISQRTYVNGGVKYIFGGEKVGTPANEGTVVTAVAPTGASPAVGGYAARLFNGAPLLKGVCRSIGSYNVNINFHDLVVLSHDFNQNQGQDIRYRDIDPSHSTPTASEKNRLFVRFPDSHQGAVGLNTEQPQALFDVRGYYTGDPTTTLNSYLTGGYQDGAINNRSPNIQQLVSSVGTHNFLMVSGGIGSTASVAAPTFSSSFKHALGIWGDCEANKASLAAAPNGLNQTPALSVSWGQNAGNPQLSFFGVPLVSRQVLPGAASDPATTQTLANSLRTALIALGLGI